MPPPLRFCQYFNCDATNAVQLYNVVHDLYFYLCTGHASLLISARRSHIALIEFLVGAAVGDDRNKRAVIRQFILDEVEKASNGK